MSTEIQIAKPKPKTHPKPNHQNPKLTHNPNSGAENYTQIGIPKTQDFWYCNICNPEIVKIEGKVPLNLQTGY